MMRSWPMACALIGAVVYLALITAWFVAGWAPSWPWSALILPLCAAPAAGVAIIYYGARKTRYQGEE